MKVPNATFNRKRLLYQLPLTPTAGFCFCLDLLFGRISGPAPYKTNTVLSLIPVQNMLIISTINNLTFYKYILPIKQPKTKKAAPFETALHLKLFAVYQQS